MNTIDPALCLEVALELQVPVAFVEKDWYAVQLLATISRWSFEGVTPLFTGGTSLSKAHRIIYRFSEDVDLRLRSEAPLNRKKRSQVRDSLLNWIEQDGWEVADSFARNESRFLGIEVCYPTTVPSGGLRPFLKLDVVFNNPRRPVVECHVRSFVAELNGEPSEVSGISCLSVEEIAAEKLSALCWRLEDIEQPDRRDLVRHLHDLACVQKSIECNDGFKQMVLDILKSDLAERTQGGEEDVSQKLRGLIPLLAVEGEAYSRYVQQASYARSEQSPPNFTEALAGLDALIARLL